MQHLLFSSPLDEKEAVRVSTKHFGQVGDAKQLAGGVQGLFYDLGYCAITEMRLASGQRADVIGLDRRGRFVVAEIKISRADLQADRKWLDYLSLRDDFYFAVPADFPIHIAPDESGLIVADQFNGEILRPSWHKSMETGRRKQQIMQFARTAGTRLYRYQRQGL